jgi:CheY-like chemotaxis protein
MNGRVFQILLVEDHPADVALTRKALGRLNTPTSLHVTVDGIDAMAFLRREGRYQTVVRPDLVLLDLNMPRRDGRAVLREVKADPELQVLPVIVLTTSSASHDIRLAYALHANGYVVKPVVFEDFVAALEAIEQFWLSVAHLPPYP